MLSSPFCVLQAYNNSRDFMMNLWDLTEVSYLTLSAAFAAQHDCMLPLLTCRIRPYPQWMLALTSRSLRCRACCLDMLDMNGAAAAKHLD